MDFFKEVFSKKCIKSFFSVWWGLLKKFAIWVIILLLSVIFGFPTLANSFETQPATSQTIHINEEWNFTGKDNAKKYIWILIAVFIAYILLITLVSFVMYMTSMRNLL